MDKKTTLFLIGSTIPCFLITIYLQMTNDNSNFTNSKRLFYIALCINAILISMNVAQRFYLYIKSTHLIQNNFKNCIFTLIVDIQLIIFTILTAVDYENSYNYVQKFDVLIICVLISSILAQIIHLTTSQDEERSNFVNLMQGLDYGTSMAYNYYYGYLRFVLPATGSLNKGLVEKLENLEDKHNINIAIHKLIILIPESSYIPPDLKEISYKWMESAIGLEDEVRDRAGVKNRSYRNILYKIYPNGERTNSKPLYVAVEGATPLVTFAEVQKHAHTETELYSKYRKDIIKKFYEKLKQLISANPECTDLCELIYYNDYDENGKKINIAEIILDRLQRLQN